MLTMWSNGNFKKTLLAVYIGLVLFGRLYGQLNYGFEFFISV